MLVTASKKGLTAMFPSKRSTGVAPEVNLGIIQARNQQVRDPHTTRKQRLHPGFETTGRRHQKSKTGVSVTPQKGLTPPNLYFKKNTHIFLAHVIFKAQVSKSYDVLRFMLKTLKSKSADVKCCFRGNM